MITNYLPKFKVFESNNLTGLRSGHILAQFPANAAIASKVVGGQKFIENGIIVGLDGDGTINNFDKAKHGQMFIHFTEELNTFMKGLQYFAVEPDEDGKFYPRCVALYVGDSFTTNNVAADVAGATYAKSVAGVLTLQTVADADTAFIVKKGSIPTGEVGYEFTFYKMPKATV